MLLETKTKSKTKLFINPISKLRVYIIASLISILILTLVLEFWKANFQIPFGYTGDALIHSVWIKSIIDNGWYLHNKLLGAPFGSDLYDFPMADSFNFLLIKGISIFSHNYPVVLNLFFVLTFVLTAITATFTFRYLKISVFTSIIFALLFAFLPYHFWRGEVHLLLSAYYMVPLVTLVLLLLWSAQSIFFSERKLSLLNPRALSCILFCLITGSTGVYYAFFSCFFIAVASFSKFLHKRDRQDVIDGSILIFLISISVFFNILPSLIYILINGIDSKVAHRSPSEAELYGLKIIHLLLPTQGHRFPIFRELINKYDAANPPLQNENTFASLGIFGSIGFLSLLFIIIFKPIAEKFTIHRQLAILNISGILLATIGGFGSLFALIVSPEIRGYNRIVVFIAFFSLLAVALFVETLRRRYVKNRQQQLLFNVLLSLILVIGILDQTAAIDIPDYAQTKDEYTSDQSFVHAIEQSVPKNSMVFQLPHVDYPEPSELPNQIPTYDIYNQARGYLHSNYLRWSYGAMKGRHADYWQELVAKEPPNILIPKLSAIGFSGIYVDRSGYTDNGQQIEAQLETITKTEPIISQNNQLSFFNLKRFNQSFYSKYSYRQIAAYREMILNPLEIKWKQGFYNSNPTILGDFRWCAKDGILEIKNPGSQTRNFSISMSLVSGWYNYSNLHVESQSLSKDIRINSVPTPISLQLSLQPKQLLKIKFTSDAQQVHMPSDPRNLFFGVINFKVIEMSDILNQAHSDL